MSDQLQTAAVRLDGWVNAHSLQDFNPEAWGSNRYSDPLRHRYEILVASLQARAESARLLQRFQRQLSTARSAAQAYRGWRGWLAPFRSRQARASVLAAERKLAEVQNALDATATYLLPADLVGLAREEVDWLQPVLAERAAEEAALRAVAAERRRQQEEQAAQAAAAAAAAAAVAAAAAAEEAKLQLVPLDGADDGADAGASSSGGDAAPACAPSFSSAPLDPFDPLALFDDDEPEQSFEAPR